MGDIREVILTLSTVHCGHLLHLQCYMELFTGFLIREDREYSTWDDARKVLDIRKRSITDFKKAMLDNDIIERTANEDGEVVLRVNPRYHFRNELPENKRVIKTFTNRLKEMAEELKPHEVGMVYKLNYCRISIRIRIRSALIRLNVILRRLGSQRGSKSRSYVISQTQRCHGIFV
ncbi:hypothetical protein [Mechercharimyces sp. CAU 1602]|uniref:hypothetical protein n=1 Tax=Mechercharimyces sp. CAU 1602 TaxID=2973933 RepID=UPI002161ED91|nr:hypothetical protein [Mechercharimyces sp. CAU 1602]MCS1351706.1 hypothetical protein [Mechercharimyces sp. CAU 1602]